MSVKAFELVPTIERLALLSEKSTSQIVCLECCGKNIYFGTDDCFVIHFLVEERVGQNGRVQFSSEKQGHKFLGLKKPVVQLKAASAINRIMVLCDSTLSLLNMLNLEPVLSGAKIRGITAFCLNENPMKSNPFSIEICVTQKRSIQIYTVFEDRMTATRDISLSDVPQIVSMDGVYVCVAFASEYKIVNIDTGHIQELFAFDSTQVTPTVTKISKDEYLLNAANALGIFAQVKCGASMRPPLQWSNHVTHVAFTHPYILTLNDEFITVHSILDQQQKQTIPFTNGKCMGEFDGRIFISTARDVYHLYPVPLEKQIQSLLTDRRVTEALELARSVHKTGLTKENFSKMYRRIEQQAGFIEFEQLYFDEARDLFIHGRLDVRELITLYPGLMPSNSSFVRCIPTLHDIADVNQLSRGEPARLRQYKKFLMEYLRACLGSAQQQSYQLEMETALLKLYAEIDSPELIPLLKSCSAHISDVTECIEWLKKYKRYHALGLLHRIRSEYDSAVDIWTRIVSGDLEDASFPGLPFIVEFLANCRAVDMVWKYADWVMERDELVGVEIFINRPNDETPDDRLRPDFIVDYLSRFQRAIVVYLEFLIFTKKAEKESYHTHLAVLYLDTVLQMLKSKNTTSGELEASRRKLSRLLQESNLYRAQLLLGKIKDTELYAECAILYGKLGDHERALRLLVHKMRDFSAAENYCFVNSSSSDVSLRARLFHTLLAVYLDPNAERRELMVAPAISLLNNNRTEFDTAKVLQSIPDSWSLGLLHQFLMSSVRKSLNRSRTTHIQRMLSRCDNLDVRKQVVQLTRNPFYMTEDRTCAACGRCFSDAAFMMLPNGSIAHIHCGAPARTTNSAVPSASPGRRQ